MHHTPSGDAPRWETFKAAGIDLPHNPRAANVKVHCPQCHDERRNKSDKSLSVNVREGIWVCHHCSWSGRLWQKREDFMSFKPQPKVYVRPSLPKTGGQVPLSEKSVAWLRGRGLSTQTIARFRLTDGREWMPARKEHKAGERNALRFPYYRRGELINVKYRDGLKCFKMEAGAEPIFFNLDAIAETDYAVIVEGEIDAMSFHEAGIAAVVSVPNGASRGNANLEYLDTCWEYFEKKTRIVLATDADEPGQALKAELARRLGKDRCLTVAYPEGCKDANEVLLTHGEAALRLMVEKAEPWPLEGIVSAEDINAELEAFWRGGLPEGDKVGYNGFDNLLSFAGGQLTCITGIPGSGKSAFVDQLMQRLAARADWRFGIYSPEAGKASLHAISLMSKYLGRGFVGRNRMSDGQRSRSTAWVHDHFYFFDIDEDNLTVESILDKAKTLVLRRGIRGLLIDPWNHLDHLGDINDTQYVNNTLGKIIAFARRHDVHVFLVAHPTKIKKDNTGKYLVPTLYDISGSANFYNRTYNGFCVWRDFDTNLVRVFVQKVKFWWQGSLGVADFEYEVGTGRYREVGTAWESDFERDHPPGQQVDIPAERAFEVLSNQFPVAASQFLQPGILPPLTLQNETPPPF